MGTKKIVLIILLVVIIAVVLIVVLGKDTDTALKCAEATPNQCNGQCWSNCSANQIFKCEASGGVCIADPNNCPASAPNSCNGQCWACNPGEKFICGKSGGTCQKK